MTCKESGCRIPARETLGGLCPDHFADGIRALLSKRQQVIIELSKVDREIERRVDLLDTPTNPSIRRSILHRCVCGFASMSYLVVEGHVQTTTNGREHAHEDRWMIPPSTKKRTTGRRVIPDDVPDELLG